MKDFRGALLAVVTALASWACGGEEGATTGRAADAGAPDGGSADRCTAFASEHEELLNAPTEATVIRKTPAHPPVGEGGLP